MVFWSNSLLWVWVMSATIQIAFSSSRNSVFSNSTSWKTVRIEPGSNFAKVILRANHDARFEHLSDCTLELDDSAPNRTAPNNFSIDLTRDNYIHIPMLQQSTEYAIQVTCRSNRSVESVTTTRRVFETMETQLIAAPKNLRAYLNSRLRFNINPHYRITLQWSPLDWRGNRPLATQSQCVFDYLMSNGTRTQIPNRYFSQWFEPVAEHEFPKHAESNFSFSRVKGVVCKVRGIGGGASAGLWAQVEVDLAILNPPSKLAILHQFRPEDVLRLSYINLDQFYNQHMIDIMTYPYELDETNDFHSITGPAALNHAGLPGDFDHYVEARELEPNSHFDWSSFSSQVSKIFTYTQDWVSSYSYIVSFCEEGNEDGLPKCLYRTDDETVHDRLKLVHQSSNEIRQVVVSPFTYLVWTERVRGRNNEISGHKIYMKDTDAELDAEPMEVSRLCKGLDPLVLSEHISMEWRATVRGEIEEEPGKGAVIVLTRDGSVVRVNIDPATRRCYLRKRIEISQPVEQIRKIAIDWNNFYWLRDIGNKSRLQFKSLDMKDDSSNERRGNQEEVGEVQVGYSLNSNLFVDLADSFPDVKDWLDPEMTANQEIIELPFDTIHDFLAYSPEMRIFPKCEDLYPEIEHPRIKMISETSARIDFQLKWPERFRSPFKMDARIRRILEPSEPEHCDDKEYPCVPWNKDVTFQRSDNRFIVLSKLTPDAEYVLEVEMKLVPDVRGDVYSMEVKKKCEGKSRFVDVFKSKYTPPWSVRAIVLIVVAFSCFLLLVTSLLGIRFCPHLRRKWQLRQLKGYRPEDITDFKLLSDQGAFGKVYKAVLEGKTIVAKVLKRAETMDQRDLLSEAIILSQIQDLPVVKIIGIVMDPGAPMLLLEYYKEGSLHSFLKRHENKLTVGNLYEIILQVARVAAELNENGYIHGDLGPHNVLVAGVDEGFLNRKEGEGCSPTMLHRGKKGIKLVLSDFGLAAAMRTEEKYVYWSINAPVRRNPPEALRVPQAKLTRRHDVYSFGILMWEVMSYGVIPFASIKCSDELKRRRRGNTNLRPAPFPSPCPQILKTIMCACWEPLPDRRSMKEIADLLEFCAKSIERDSWNQTHVVTNSRNLKSGHSNDKTNPGIDEENYVISYNVSIPDEPTPSVGNNRSDSESIPMLDSGAQPQSYDLDVKYPSHLSNVM